MVSCVILWCVIPPIRRIRIVCKYCSGIGVAVWIRCIWIEAFGVMCTGSVWPLHTFSSTIIAILEHIPEFMLGIYERHGQKNTYSKAFNFKTVSQNNNLICLFTQCPKISFPFAATISGHFDETLVQAQIVPNGILPSFFVSFEIWKFGCYKCVNLTQCCTSHRRTLLK